MDQRGAEGAGGAAARSARWASTVSDAATTATMRQAMVSAVSKAAAWERSRLLPTHSARVVPAIATPTLLPTSWLVSLSADPVEVLSGGSERITAMAEEIITTRIAAVITTVARAIQT